MEEGISLKFYENIKRDLMNKYVKIYYSLLLRENETTVIKRLCVIFF